METYTAPMQPTQVNNITSSCEICSGPHDIQYCIENPEQALVEYASSRTDEEGGLSLELCCNGFIPSCIVIFDLEPLSLSFDLVFSFEIFKYFLLSMNLIEVLEWEHVVVSLTVLDKVVTLSSVLAYGLQSCFLDIQLTSLLPWNCFPPEVILHLSRQPTWSVSEKAKRTDKIQTSTKIHQVSYIVYLRAGDGVTQGNKGKHQSVKLSGDDVWILPKSSTSKNNQDLKVIFDEKKLGSRKAHLLEDKEILSVGVFDEVFLALGGNTRDLGSFGEETDEIIDLHQALPKSIVLRAWRWRHRHNDTVVIYLVTIKPPTMMTKLLARHAAHHEEGKTSGQRKRIRTKVVLVINMKMESVQDMSGCRDNQKVKYTAGSFVGMSWEDFKTLIREEFCPSNEMQKLETELWNHAMVRAGHAAYTDRFHELARLVSHLVTL
ncbi:reverse transcriptase domain-containing protein [Tanacetum coccineum]